MAKILCIDDEVEITQSLSLLLSLYGHEVFVSNSAVDGTLLAATIKDLDLIILDVRLSDSNGIEVCEVLKSNKETKSIPIIFLSALATPEEKVRGLRKGACDYIAKPFDSDELSERINIALMHRERAKNDETNPRSDYYLNEKKRVLKLQGVDINLTKKEFDIFNYLYVNRNKVVEKRDIQRNIWKNITVGTRTIDTHIINIRKKIRDSDIKINTKFGEGYSLVL